MSVQTAHLDALAAYIAEHGKQRQGAICEGMLLANPDILMRRYLFKLLRKQGRIEKVGYDSYRAVAETPDDERKQEDAADTERAKAWAAKMDVVADLLDTPEAISAYVLAVFEDGNPELISSAIGDVASAMAILLIKRVP